jgi:hypothetical protein
MNFLITASGPRNVALDLAIRAIGGRSLTAHTWLLFWQQPLESLCLALRKHRADPIVICPADCDWRQI